MVPRCHNNNNNNSDDDDDDDDDDYHDDGDESEHRELLNDHIRSLLGPDSTSTTTSRSGPSTAPSHNPTPATPPSMNFSDNAGRKNAGRKNAASADGVKQAPVEQEALSLEAETSQNALLEQNRNQTGGTSGKTDKSGMESGKNDTKEEKESASKGKRV